MPHSDVLRRGIVRSRPATLLVPALAFFLGFGGASGTNVAAAIRRVLDSGAHPWLRAAPFADRAPEVRRLYESVAFRPIWVRDGRPTDRAEATMNVLAAAAARGLDPEDYDAGRLRTEALRLRSRATAEDLARYDTALTIAVMRYAREAYLGRIDPARVSHAIESAPRPLDLVRLVADLAERDDPAPALAALDPPVPTFARLRQALATTRALAARADLPEVPESLPVLHPGERHAGVAAVRTRLVALGDLPESRPPADESLYDPALVAAVERFQARHGRDVDGVVGRVTHGDLRVPLAVRAEQIALAMERLRWYSTDAGRYVVVNLPEFRLHGFDGRNPEPVLSMNVVVGSAARRTTTPVVHGHLRRVIFRPYWEVPASIARNEILPRAAREPGYLARERIEHDDGRLRQRPGPDNALGLVKFIFPNPYDVYLHDTPQKHYFERSRRDFSHGCMRVADATALAEFVLGWDRERVESAMHDGPDDRAVELPEGIAVYVLYSTVAVEGDRVLFFDDIYGYDAELASALRDR